jgi:hypothetical protein
MLPVWHRHLTECQTRSANAQRMPSPASNDELTHTRPAITTRGGGSCVTLSIRVAAVMSLATKQLYPDSCALHGSNPPAVQDGLAGAYERESYLI